MCWKFLNFRDWEVCRLFWIWNRFWAWNKCHTNRKQHRQEKWNTEIDCVFWKSPLKRVSGKQSRQFPWHNHLEGIIFCGFREWWHLFKKCSFFCLESSLTSYFSLKLESWWPFRRVIHSFIFSKLGNCCICLYHY